MFMVIVLGYPITLLMHLFHLKTSAHKKGCFIFLTSLSGINYFVHILNISLNLSSCAHSTWIGILIDFESDDNGLCRFCSDTWDSNNNVK